MPVGKFGCRDTEDRPRTPGDQARWLRSGDIVPPLRPVHEASRPGNGFRRFVWRVGDCPLVQSKDQLRSARGQEVFAVRLRAITP